MRLRYLARTGAAVSAAAAAGALGTEVSSRWYQNLDKPRWQPPAAAFAPVWTAIYALMSLAGARTLERLEPGQRRDFAAALAANLSLNAGWSWLFFRARRPRWALAEIALLEASTLELARRAARVDHPAAAMLVPAAGWIGFAALLNAAIAYRNPQPKEQP